MIPEYLYRISITFFGMFMSVGGGNGEAIREGFGLAWGQRIHPTSQLPGLWLAGMEEWKKWKLQEWGYTGTTIWIHSFIPS